MMKTKTFKGANMFMSRNLVPPEIFDALHDALKQNGADVFLCCDPSRNGPNDFHIISSPEHDKFEDLRAKGCNLLGPQCVLSCAKEHKALPKQGFTCCLAMDGVKVLASGFEMDEKVKIGKLVTSMGGVLHTKASMDVNFVIVKNVLAAKYKWALNILKKPIVSVNWLHQCWNEHRVVPQESFRVLTFSGLTICVTRILADERKKIEKLIIQHGGKYSAELTKKCTHLISDATEGDKYKVARKWGHIHIVTRKWLDQSIARKACLNEESYPLQGGSVSSIKTARGCLTTQHSQDKGIRHSQSVPSSVAADSNFPPVPCAGFVDPDLEATLSQNTSSTFFDAPVFISEEDSEAPITQPKNEINLDGCVANDSQTEDNDLYLSDCRIFLAGFEASEMRKLVNMVRRGGGSRYMSFNDKLTHIIIGTPSEIEKREVRGLAAMGVIYVVKSTWLEDCDRQKKEIPVLQRHIAYDLVVPKGKTTMNQVKSSTVTVRMPSDQLPGTMNSGIGMSMERNREGKPERSINDYNSPEATVGLNQKSSVVDDTSKVWQRLQHDSKVQNMNSTGVFEGRIFLFSNSFPEDRRAEIVQWVNQGGGEVVDANVKQNVHFTIECHGVIPKSADVPQTNVSSHWIRSCLEAGCLLDVGSHILYSPLPCRIPLPGFGSFRFCVSQYEEKDRLLLKNLCFVLGAKFVEKLTKKVTHLLCKFTNGPKYEAACKWGIQSVTSDWIYECVRQNEVVSMVPFFPKEVTALDREAGLCTMTQFPTQANKINSGDNSSQFASQSQDFRNSPADSGSCRNDSFRKEAKHSAVFSKMTRILEDGGRKGLLFSEAQTQDKRNTSRISATRNDSSGEEVKQSSFKRIKVLDDDGRNGLHSSEPHLSDPSCNVNSTGGGIFKDNGEVSHIVPDVAAAIEDLLEQTSKIHDLKSPGRTPCDRSIFSSDCSIIGQDNSDPHSVVGLSKHWSKTRTEKKDDLGSSGDVHTAMYDGFSETQTDSQVVGYEEDLSGRQMIIDRVRTRSSMT